MTDHATLTARARRPASRVAGLVLAVALWGCSGSSPAEPPCPAGQARCGGACVDLQITAAHCGACTTACRATQVCVSGGCSCPGGTSACGDACADLQSSLAHCGTCDNACPGFAACVAGTCLAVCTPPASACGLACFDLAASAAACGRCGRACAGGASCAAGACTASACPGHLGLPGAPRLAARLDDVDVAVGDLDGDGVLDAVTAGWNTVSVLRGAGGGWFDAGTPVTLPTTQAAAVELADLDADGRLDLVVADRAGWVYVARGRGDGTFGGVTATGVGAGANGVAVADFDGDGRPDLAVSAEGSYLSTHGDGTILRGLGDGTFSLLTVLSTDTTPSSVAAGDLDGDGLADAVMGQWRTGQASVYLSREALAAEHLLLVGGQPQDVALADLDGDARLDLVTTATLTVSFGRGDGTFEGATSYPGVGAYGLAVGDFTGDGRRDVATSLGDLLVNGGSRLFTLGRMGAFLSGYGVAAGDLDGDGRLDLASSGGAVALQGQPGWGLPAVLRDGGWALALADVDDDLDPDLVGWDGSMAPVLFTMAGRGDGSFAAPVSTPGPSGVRLAATGDLDGGGVPDVVLWDGASLSTWSGDGAGGFSAGPTLGPGDGLPAFIDQLLLADLDADGRDDLLIRAGTGTADSFGELTVRLRLAAGGFGVPSVVAGDATAAAAADVDGDGKVDLLVGRRYSTSLAVFHGDGSGAFGTPLPIAITNVVLSVVAGDLDGDGDADLVLTAGQDLAVPGAFVAVLPGLGGRVFGTPIHELDGRLLTSPLLADLDGDGFPELLVQDAQQGQLLLFRNAAGTLSAPEVQLVNAPPVAAVDVDRDGRPDVLLGGSAQRPVLLESRCLP